MNRADQVFRSHSRSWWKLCDAFLQPKPVLRRSCQGFALRHMLMQLAACCILSLCSGGVVDPKMLVEFLQVCEILDHFAYKSQLAKLLQVR